MRQVIRQVFRSILLGSLASVMMKEEEAFQVYLQVIQLNPQETWARANYGSWRIKVGEYETALNNWVIQFLPISNILVLCLRRSV